MNSTKMKIASIHFCVIAITQEYLSCRLPYLMDQSTNVTMHIQYVSRYVHSFSDASTSLY